MARSKLVLVLALAAVMVVALGAGAASAFAGGWPDQHQALFVQTDDLTANSIMVYDRGPDGTLTYGGTYLTGGLGGQAAGSQVDPLASQGSLAAAEDGHVLLAVNAGSDSVSLFRVAGGDMLRLKQVTPSGGQFPVSIAVHGDLVYVLNAGLEGGFSCVQGYWLDGNHLTPIPLSNRSLGPTDTTHPFFLASPGMVGFSPDGRRLVVTTKFSGSLIDVFSVGPRGLLSSTSTANLSATPVPFAFSFDPWGRLVTVEVGSSGISSYSFNPDNSLTTIGSANDQIDGVAASCWISTAAGYYFVSNAGSANLSIYTSNASGVPSLIGMMPTTAAAGTTDSVTTSDGHFLYVECGSAGVVLAYRIHADGSLSLIQTVSGLPIPFEGIALSQ